MLQAVCCAIQRQFNAAILRHRMKMGLKKRGYSTDLKAEIAYFRKSSPEYADTLERLIYPTLRIDRG